MQNLPILAKLACARILPALVFSALLCNPATYSQSTGGGNGNGTGNGGLNSTQGTSMGRGGFGHTNMGPDDYDQNDPAILDRRLRALNAERQKQMVADTNKLLKLARELNDEVASTNEESFTPDQLHKIAEIEKLARSVRERMTTAVGEAPSLVSPPPTVGYPMH